MRIMVILILLLQILSAQNLKGQNQLVEGESHYRLYIKYRKEARIDVVDGNVQSYSPSRSLVTPNLDQLIPNGTFRQLVALSSDQRHQVRSRSAMPPSSSKGFDKRAFSGLVELEEAKNMSPKALLTLANKLEEYDVIEYVQLSPITPTPLPSVIPSEATPSRSTSRAITPDFTSQQFYNYGVDQQNSDIIGIYADYAWGLGITGQGVSFADCEWGWNYDHEDFAGQNVISGISSYYTDGDDHGTSVLGIMYAAKNDIGMTGAVHGADAFYGFSVWDVGNAVAILQAIDSLEAGDVLLYELQTPGASGGFGPADYEQAVWDITKAASDAGIIIVAAAGNGSENLDSDGYSAYRARGDNGSIIVGGAEKVGRHRAYFSTYGNRVNLCGIGDWSVPSTGHTDLYDGGPNASYTATFSGTSSSTPIVASAVVSVQSFAKTSLNITLSSRDMRSLLIKTGTPQGDGHHIGPLPNIKAAIIQLQIDSSGGTPDPLYTLNVIHGLGSGPYKVNTSVTVTAKDSVGYIFSEWSGDITGLQNYKSITTTLTTTATHSAITANYTVAPTYLLTVNNGLGGGDYPATTNITITAPDSTGYLFDTWVGDTLAITDTRWAKTTLTMPHKATTISATYRPFDLTLIAHNSIVVDSTSSEHSDMYGNTKILDGDNTTFWHTGGNITFPQEIIFKLSEEHFITGFNIQPRQDRDNARVKEYKIETSLNGTTWDSISTGELANTHKTSYKEFAQKSATAMYLKLTIFSSQDGVTDLAIAGFNIYGEKAPPVVGVAPTLTSTTPQTTAEDTQITLLLSMTDGADADGDALTLIVGGGDNYRVNSTTITPAADFTGTLVVPIRVSDGSRMSATVNMSITVTPVDDAPVVKMALSQITVEKDADDTEVLLSSLFTDIDNDDALIVKTVKSNSNEALLTVSIVSNTLTLSYVADEIGTATIEILGTSNGKTVVAQLSVEVTTVTAIDLDDDVAQTGIQDLILYPNPVPYNAYKVDLIIPSELSGDWIITIYDVLGNRMDHSAFTAFGGTTYSWDLHTEYGDRVDGGTYVLIARFTGNNGKSKMFKRMIGVKQ